MFGGFPFGGGWFGGFPTLEDEIVPVPVPDVDVIVCLYYDCCVPDQFEYDLQDPD